MKKIGMVAAAIVAVGGLATAAHAGDEPGCSGGNQGNHTGQTIHKTTHQPKVCDGGGAGLLGSQIMSHTGAALADALAHSFNMGDDTAAPGATSVGAIIGSNTHVQPVADVPAAFSDPRWNSWIDGKYTYNDANAVALNQDGGLWNGLAGVDYKLTRTFTLGLMGSAESADMEGPVSSLKTSGAGLGPYVGYTLGDHIVLSASVLGTSIDTRQFDILTGTYHFGSTRLQATAGATGYWYLGGWRLTPGASLAWSKEWLRERDNLLPDHTVEVAMLTPSVQTGRSFALSDTLTVEPWAGAAWDWSFYNRVKYDGFPATNDPTYDLRLQAGLNFGIGSHAQLAITGEMGGLVNSAVRTYSGEANLAIQF